MKQETITIQTEYIRLDHLLKMCASVGSGGQAKIVIQTGQVVVNGAQCTQRGKKLRGGDQVHFDGHVYEVRCEN